MDYNTNDMTRAQQPKSRDIEVVRERGQIPTAFDRLSKNVAMLAEMIDMLENRLGPVVDKNLTKGLGSGAIQTAAPAPPVCGLAESLRNIDGSVEYSIDRLQSLLGNIQL